jgi:hypothetical protein
MLSDKEKQEIREGFEKEFDGLCLGSTQGTSDANKKDLADYFLSIIEKKASEKVKEKLESVEKEIEELPKIFVDDIYKGANLVRYTDVLGIIHKHKGE